ncbi:Mu transposase C-terminal domain-containing protein [Streptomyces sp. NPDC006733]|uniref:Mu transposase C-terminal domain-containing protein n=1 Tax=Streptomyces sp. NPDC006733 TaxID=3155460 RepID=UPI0033D40880
MLDVIARNRGNVSAAHQELTAAEKQAKAQKPADTAARDPAQPKIPSLATFHRAAHRHLNPGQRAGLRKGESTRRAFDVFGKRERHHRNYAWETDHVEASVKVLVDGHIRKPWITWFVDSATDGICGLCITPQTPSRESILVALRDALLTTSEHGPLGGRPERLRVDGGKDFLCKTVDEAVSALGTELIVLPPRRPDLKPTVEAINGAVKKTLFADMPGYAHAPTLAGNKPVDPNQQLLHYEDFVIRVLDWARRWNTEHALHALDGKTPAQAWAADITPLTIINPEDVHTFTLERRGKPVKINNDGVHWRGRTYVEEWMSGRAGERVHLRYMPHHDHRVELYDPQTGTHLGAAFCTTGLTPAQRRSLDRGRTRQANDLRKRLKKAERDRKVRYAATSQPASLLRLDPLTPAQAEQQLRELGGTGPVTDAPPSFVPLPAPTDGWAVPRPRPEPTDSTGRDHSTSEDNE